MGRGAIGVGVAVVAALLWTVSLGAERLEAGPELEPLGRDELRGVDRYRVTLQTGATLWDLASARLPLTRLERDEAEAYWLVLESFGRAFPGRQPNTVKPGESFLLEVPTGTFVAMGESGDGDSLVYRSFSGDQLTVYLRNPVLLYRLVRSGKPNQAEVRVSGQSEAAEEVARAIYDLEQPDFLQVRTVRGALGEPGRRITVDQSRRYLDDFRNYRQQATSVKSGADGRSIYTFDPLDGTTPFLRVEDAVGERTDPSDFPREFRLAFYRDGTIRRYVLTDYGDTLGAWSKPDAARWREIVPGIQDWEPGVVEPLPPFAPAVNELGSLIPERLLVLRYAPTPPDQARAGTELDPLEELLDLMRRLLDGQSIARRESSERSSPTQTERPW
jgi:hypothetical protein